MTLRRDIFRELKVTRRVLVLAGIGSQQAGDEDNVL